MSVDPLIQAPTSTQSINPYSYIMNNPLAGTDPTGYAADCDSEGNNCNVGEIPVEDVENIQQHEDGSIIVNTTDGESYKIDNGTNSSADVGLDLSANTVTGKHSDKGKKSGANPNGRIVKQTDGTVLVSSEEDGITSVDDGVPEFDETHEDFHTYYLENSCSKANAGCSLERVRGGLLRYPAPGATGTPIVDEQVGDAIIGLVRHEVSEDGEVINITLPPGQNKLFPKHLLDPGIVRRWVTQDKNSVYIHTYGEGTGPFGQLNSALKHQVWDSVDNQALNWATGAN